MAKVKVSIVAAAGYTASELLRILAHHPNTELACLYSSSQAGRKVTAVHEDLWDLRDMDFDSQWVAGDVIFLCGGHGRSKQFMAENEILENALIIDLSQDFRTTGDFGFIYGLPEAFAPQISNSKRIANPGCFATCIQLALLPLAQHSLLEEDLHISSITGTTGAGQEPSATTHYSWRHNNISAYKPFTHQHESEIHQTLQTIQPTWKHRLCWVPLRGCFTRGIFSSIHTRTSADVMLLRGVYEEFCQEHTFVHLLPPGQSVHMKQVVNTNHCALQVEKHGEYAHVTVCIDNLIKGAAGQAVQNMNLAMDFPLDAGLHLKAIAF